MDRHILGSSVIWSDKVCHLCLKFEVMSHGGTESTEVLYSRNR